MSGLCFDENSRGHEDAKHEEAAGRRGEDGHGVQPLGQHLEAEEGAHAQNFPDGAHDNQGQGEAQAHAQAIQRGVQHRVFGGKQLRPAQNDTVDHDQGQIDAQRLIQIWQESLDSHHQHSDEAGDDGDEGGQADFVRNDLAQGGHRHVGADEHEGGGQAHAQAVGGHGGDGQGGAGAQHQTQGGILLEQAIGEDLKFLVHVSSPLLPDRPGWPG